MRAEIESYLAQRQAEGLSPATLRCYRRSCNRLDSFLASKGIKRWAEVTQAHIDEYLAWNEQTVKAWSSRENLRIEVRAFCRWLAERGLVLSDPARHVELPRPEKNDLPLLEAPLSEADVARLLESMPRRNAVDLRNIAVMELFYSAGLRRAEALALNTRDVDLINRTVHVRNGKGSKPRDVPMLRGLYGALRDYLALRRSMLKGPDAGALLLTLRGTRMGAESLHAIFQRRSKHLKRHVHAHLLRHSIAVHLLRGGADIRYVQAFLGHDDIESTKIYLRLVPADLRKAYDAAMPEISVST